MRRNPNVCVQVDQITTGTKWVSVIVNGSYQELVEPQFKDERKRARKMLDEPVRWWQTALAERQSKSGDELIAPLFFRIHADSVTGMRALD